MKRLMVVAVLVMSCSNPPAVYPHAPVTANACADACTVLQVHECSEALPDPATCTRRCEAIARLGYVWKTDTTGPVCIREADTLDAVRACNVRCDGGR